MLDKTIIVTCTDHNAFDLATELIASIRSACPSGIDIGCYDTGLQAEQSEFLRSQNVAVVKPTSGLAGAASVTQPFAMASLARPYLKENFPGYAVYVWMDADSWVQRGEALDGLIKGAHSHGASLIKESDPTYRSNFGRWRVKHYLRAFGSWKGGQLSLQKQINDGVFAMHAAAPHWELWRRHFQQALDRTGEANPYDQLAMNAMHYLDSPPTCLLPATFNWICNLSNPVWDDDRGCFCSPSRDHEPIQVVHLAGSLKRSGIRISSTRGRTLFGPLRFGAEIKETGSVKAQHVTRTTSGRSTI